MTTIYLPDPPQCPAVENAPEDAVEAFLAENPDLDPEVPSVWADTFEEWLAYERAEAAIIDIEYDRGY